MKLKISLIVIFSFFITANSDVLSELSSPKQGDNLQAVIEETCAYDKQMCTADPESSMARLTNNAGMTGNALKNVLGDDGTWIYEDSLYPRLKTPNVEEPKFIEAANYVAAAPLFLRILSKSNFDTYDNVRYCFAVSYKNGVRWKSVNGLVEINDYTQYVRLLAKGWDTLIAYIELPIPEDERINDTDTVDVISKMIPINITDLINNCNFSIPNFTVKLTADPEVAGTVTGAGTYPFNTKVPITAEANTGYTFRHWRDLQNNVISEVANFELTVKSNTTLIASFIPISYSVTITANPNYMGDLDGYTTGVYPYGFEGTVTAEPKADIYKFLYWSNSNSGEDTLTTDPTLNFVIKSDTLFVAHFSDTVSIVETIKIETVNIIPNPTKDDFVISFEVLKPCNLNITFTDILGKDIFEIFSDWTNEGIFTKTVNTKNLSRGVYYIKIQIDGSFTVKKIILE